MAEIFLCYFFFSKHVKWLLCVECCSIAALAVFLSLVYPPFLVSLIWSIWRSNKKKKKETHTCVAIIMQQCDKFIDGIIEIEL